MDKTNYAIVGTSSRAFMYIDALYGEFKDYGDILALCDINKVRMNYTNRYINETYGKDPLPMYKPFDFVKMIKKNNIEKVIITSIDRTHHEYIIKAMEAGCDVICEKPMTIDKDKAADILKIVEKTGKKLRVTFNYRYAPRNAKVKELIQSGVIGNIKSIHFEWLLDTKHGADYFRRWHRDKRNSSGLMVHKATHHFDLVNWWLASRPSEVFAMGDLVFYGRSNAEQRGITSFYDRGTSKQASDDPFALDLKSGERLTEMYLKAEKEDGYRRDQSVFSDGISIEDDMSVIVRYENQAVMTYHLTAYSPWEGYRVCFNGDKGRLEFEVVENAYVSGEEKDPNRTDVREKQDLNLDEKTTIIVRPLWEQPYEVPIHEEEKGGHGGGDRKMLRDTFIGETDNNMGYAADHIQGALSILTGIAANKSMITGRKIKINSLMEGIK